jgi:HlyD family secretion protein
MEALYDAGAISSSELDQAKLALEESQTKVGTLKNQRDQVMISYHTALEGVDERQLAQIEISIDQLNQDIEHIDIELEKMVITAPTSGTVQSLDVKVDDLCTVGNAIGEIDVENPYVIFYVDNTQLSTLGVGDIVKVWQDDQDESFEARIYEIANRAQFTPKNVTVKKDRQQLVYRIEALLPTESGFLPGMMVDITLGEY